jgi:hypothetical protein
MYGPKTTACVDAHKKLAQKAETMLLATLELLELHEELAQLSAETEMALDDMLSSGEDELEEARAEIARCLEKANTVRVRKNEALQQLSRPSQQG